VETRGGRGGRRTYRVVVSGSRVTRPWAATLGTSTQRHSPVSVSLSLSLWSSRVSHRRAGVGETARVVGSRDEVETETFDARGERGGGAHFGVDVRCLRALVEASPGEERVFKLARLGGLPELAAALRVDPQVGLRGDDADDRAARAACFGSNEVPPRLRRQGGGLRNTAFYCTALYSVCGLGVRLTRFAYRFASLTLQWITRRTLELGRSSPCWGRR